MIILELQLAIDLLNKEEAAELANKVKLSGLTYDEYVARGV